MDDLQWRDQPAEFAGFEEMVIARGTPTEGALDRQKGLHDEHTARGDALENPRHPNPVKIIEDQNGIKNAQVRPGSLEVYRAPIDGDALGPGEVTGGLELGLVLVNGYYLGAARRSGNAVSALAGGQVKDPGTFDDQEVVPGEPGAG